MAKFNVGDKVLTVAPPTKVYYSMSAPTYGIVGVISEINIRKDYVSYNVDFEPSGAWDIYNEDELDAVDE